MDSTVWSVDTTDADGQATLTMAPSNIGDMRLVVTGMNLVPFDGSFSVDAASTEPVTDGHRHKGKHRRKRTEDLNKLQRVLAIEAQAGLPR